MGGRKRTGGSRRAPKNSGADLDGLIAVAGLAALVLAPIGHVIDKKQRRIKPLAVEDDIAAKQLTGVHRERFKRAERTVAKPQRDRWWKKPTAEALALTADEQAALDQTWDLLAAHDPDTVITIVDDALADNAMPSTCIDAGYDESSAQHFVTVAVIYAGREIAEGHTMDGDRARTRRKQERRDLYRDAVASTIVVTCAEVLATSPTTDAVHVVVLREDKVRWWKHPLAPICYSKLDRESIEATNWKRTQPWTTVFGSAALQAGDQALDALPRKENPGLYEVAAVMSSALEHE